MKLAQTHSFKAHIIGWSSLFIMTLSLLGCGLLPEKIDETKTWNADRLYQEAKDQQNEGNYARAIELFEKLEARYPYGRYAQQSQIEIAYTYYKDNEPAQSTAAADRFIRLHPNHPSVDYIYYLKGLVNFNDDLGYLGAISKQDLSERDPKAAREAFDSFKELTSRFPNSKYAPDAQARMKYLVNALAAYEVHVAKYYMKRKAYLAAANRSQDVVKNYSQTPAVEAALEVLVEAYHELGMNDLRDDAKRVLAKNFPKNTKVTNAKVQGKAWYQW